MFRSPEPKKRAESGGLNLTPAERVRGAGNDEGGGGGGDRCVQREAGLWSFLRDGTSRNKTFK